tara:strand:+ start:639 stop:851 length:213 start_codon:yes stop_codon:yes gene_type:complete
MKIEITESREYRGRAVVGLKEAGTVINGVSKDEGEGLIAQGFAVEVAPARPMKEKQKAKKAGTLAVEKEE